MSETINSKPDAMVHYADEDVALLGLAGTPENAILQASQVATAIMKVIDQKPKVIKFNSEIYFENEDWTFIGKFYGVTVRIVTDRYVEFGTAKGFEAEAEAVLSSTGQIVGRAFGMCLDDEENWGMRAKYEWVDELDANGKKIWEERIVNGKKKNLPRGKRVEVSKVKTPLFQLRSMAQTRSSSKVLSMVFKFIPVLASKGGRKVSATPAEEASEDFTGGSGSQNEEQASDKPTRAKRKEQPEAASETEKTQDPDCIAQSQVTYLYTVASKCKLSHQDVIDELKANFKDKQGKPVDSTRKILKGDFQRALDALDPKMLHHAPKGDGKEPSAQEEPGANG